MKAEDQSAEREALKSVRASKSRSAIRGHKEAGVAFVSYEGAAADLNELASYVTALERAVDAALSAREAPAQMADYEEVLSDHRRLVRELDVLLNGEAGAAKQASLCDIVAQVRREGIRSAPAREGWQLVPKEPTEEMKAAGKLQCTRDGEAEDDPKNYRALGQALCVWDDMLAASPQAPTTDPAPPAAKAVEMDADKLRKEIVNVFSLAQAWRNATLPDCADPPGTQLALRELFREAVFHLAALPYEDIDAMSKQAQKETPT